MLNLCGCALLNLGFLDEIFLEIHWTYLSVEMYLQLICLFFFFVLINIKDYGCNMISNEEDIL